MGWKLAKQVHDSWGHLSGNPYKVLNAMAWATFDEAGEHERWGWIDAGDYFGGPTRLAQLAFGFSPDEAETPKAHQRVKVALAVLTAAGAIVVTESGRKGRRARYRVTPDPVDNSDEQDSDREIRYENRTELGTKTVPNEAECGTKTVPDSVRKPYPQGGHPKEGTFLGGNNSMKDSGWSETAPSDVGPVDQSSDGDGEGKATVVDLTNVRDQIAAASERIHAKEAGARW